MSKRKDSNPLRDKFPYSDILGVEPHEIREKVRRDADAGAGSDSDEEAKDLFTSTDLFGDILAGFSEDSPASGADTEEEAGSEALSSDAEAADVGRPERSAAPEDANTNPDSPVGAAYENPLNDLNVLNGAQLDAAMEGVVAERASRERSESPEGADRPYGRYRLLGPIATGGMSEVFRATRTGVEGFEKVVAVKRILPHLSSNEDFVDMFVQEAKMVAPLSHPNIVQIFDLGRVEDSYYIAMEFVEGRDLRAILKRSRSAGKRLSVDLAALVVMKVGAALEYAHRQKDAEGNELRIVHRDVSPQNILVSNEGEVKLVDFGIAKAATKASHTDSGSLRGKLLYMSPEQAWGRPLDKRSDIFSLGAVFYEMLTGHLLFSGRSDKSILERVREARFAKPSSLNRAVPIELEAVVTRALQKNPDNRYADAAEMLADLEIYLHYRPAVGTSDLARFLENLFSG